jgi:hypothetical protein
VKLPDIYTVDSWHAESVLPWLSLGAIVVFLYAAYRLERRPWLIDGAEPSKIRRRAGIVWCVSMALSFVPMATSRDVGYFAIALGSGFAYLPFVSRRWP